MVIATCVLWTRLLGVRIPGADARELRDRQLQRRPNRRVSWISVGRIRVVSLLVSIYVVRVLESVSKKRTQKRSEPPREGDLG